MIQFYGWHDPHRGFLVSRYPPDAPVRPAMTFETAAEASHVVKKHKRGSILWIPPLPKGLDADQRKFASAQNPQSHPRLERRR